MHEKKKSILFVARGRKVDNATLTPPPNLPSPHPFTRLEHQARKGRPHRQGESSGTSETRVAGQNGIFRSLAHRPVDCCEVCIIPRRVELLTRDARLKKGAQLVLVLQLGQLGHLPVEALGRR